ncbi:MAG: hypothetical protein AAGF12_34885 [Myxococcota bacterium]
MARRTLSLVILGLAIFGPTTAEAQPPVAPPPIQLYHQHLTAARVNPLGLIHTSFLTARFRLFESASPVAINNFVGAGLTGAISPAWGRIGPRIEVQPLSVLSLFAQYEVMGTFSTFNLMASFPTANADYSDDAIEARGDDPATEGYSTSGTVLTIGALAQIKVGPIAARNNTRFIRQDFDLRDGDRVFYDQLFDNLMSDEGWFVQNDLDVLYVTDFGLAAGLRWSYGHVFYQDDDFLPTEDPNAEPDNDFHRLGLLAAYNFEPNGRGVITQPTILLICQWHLEHRWRTGGCDQCVSTGVPYFALAFQFRGDLLYQEPPAE